MGKLIWIMVVAIMLYGCSGVSREEQELIDGLVYDNSQLSASIEQVDSLIKANKGESKGIETELWDKFSNLAGELEDIRQKAKDLNAQNSALRTEVNRLQTKRSDLFYQNEPGVIPGSQYLEVGDVVNGFEVIEVIWDRNLVYSGEIDVEVRIYKVFDDMWGGYYFPIGVKEEYHDKFPRIGINHATGFRVFSGEFDALFDALDVGKNYTARAKATGVSIFVKVFVNQSMLDFTIEDIKLDRTSKFPVGHPAWEIMDVEVGDASGAFVATQVCWDRKICYFGEVEITLNYEIINPNSIVMVSVVEEDLHKMPLLGITKDNRFELITDHDTHTRINREAVDGKGKITLVIVEVSGLDEYWDGGWKYRLSTHNYSGRVDD